MLKNTNRLNFGKALCEWNNKNLLNLLHSRVVCPSVYNKKIYNLFILMRMKNRFSRMGKTLLGAMCLLSMGGITYSCSDDYDLDETMPSFLGGSIYDELKARNFTTVVRLIEDLGYKEVLAKTGSKTLFAADDDAYESFFKNNTTWIGKDGTLAKKYEDLTLSQKRWLLNGSMLNSAYVLEMLAHLGKEKNLCLRQMAAISPTDTIRYWKWNELPNNLNEGETDDEGNVVGDVRFWDKYRKESVGGIYMATDKTAPLLTHFLEGQMKERFITRADIAFILNDKNGWADTDESRSYVYGSKIIKQDITCLNGYIHQLDSVLVTPSNMAEVIRTNGNTKYFSSILERFSAPYYDYNLTEQYKALYNIEADSVFHKRYISERSIGNSQITQGPDKKSLGSFPFLPYDPGWNQLTSSVTISREKDMGAMFVPNDAAMEEYFIRGGGKVLMNRYAKKENNEENLMYNLYQIPLDIIKALVANLMKDSFIETVPSKYLTIMNDAQDQMFPASTSAFATLEKYKSCFEKCLLANNGVVYVMNSVISPADYASVIAPALYSENTQVVKTVARADEPFIQGSSYNSAPLKKYYSTYLKAMQSRFTFFVPVDEGLSEYGLVDPMSLAMGPLNTSKFRYWRVAYKNAPGSNLPLTAQAYVYKQNVGPQENDRKQTSFGTGNNESKPDGNLGAGAGLVKKTLMIDMMDHHILVHENDDVEGVNSSRKYYNSRGGAPVIVDSKGDVNNQGVGMVVYGGYQEQLMKDDSEENDYVSKVLEGYDLTAETNEYGNGMTYLIDRPMQATTNSVYGLLNKDEEHFAEFFKLCNTEFDPDDLKKVGLYKEEFDKSEWESEQNKYRIFVKGNGYNPAFGEKLIRFFNNYRYTIYVPTNDAVLAAIEAGLPTGESIHDFIEQNTITPEPVEGEEVPEPTLSPENQEKALAMITMLVNFVKYHFQDQAFYVDNTTSEGEYQTSCVDLVNNVYLSVDMKQTPNRLNVTDNSGVSQDVIEPYNLLARDANYNGDLEANVYVTSINNSSYAVLHQVAKPLNFMSDFNGRYDAQWASPAKAKAFLAKYRILK